jgi:hypothetical protein
MIVMYDELASLCRDVFCYANLVAAEDAAHTRHPEWRDEEVLLALKLFYEHLDECVSCECSELLHAEELG